MTVQQSHTTLPIQITQQNFNFTLSLGLKKDNIKL